MATKSQNQVATKKDMGEFKDDVKNYMGLLHEKFEGEVKVIAEQHVDTNRNLASINKHLGHVDQCLDKLEIKTDVLVETVADMKVDMTVMKEDMTEMKGDISELKTDMKEVKEELLPGATKKVDKLEHRVAVLESRA